MKLRTTIVGVMALAAMSAEARAGFTCGGSSLPTHDLGGSGTYTMELLERDSALHGKIYISSSSGNGLIAVELEAPDEITDPTERARWPYSSFSGRENGTSVQMFFAPGGPEPTTPMWIEGTYSVSGNVATISALEYGDPAGGCGFGGHFIHWMTGFRFSATVNINGGMANGNPIPCANGNLGLVPGTSFHYNWEINGTWYNGTVTVTAYCGSYFEATLSNPNAIPGWNSKAYGVVDSSGMMYLVHYTGIPTGSGNPFWSDPQWMWKLLVPPYYYYQYDTTWIAQNSGNWVDFY
jgi:hypothetical protein